MEFWAFIVGTVLAALVILSPIFNFKETAQQYSPYAKQEYIKTDNGETNFKETTKKTLVKAAPAQTNMYHLIVNINDLSEEDFKALQEIFRNKGEQ